MYEDFSHIPPHPDSDDEDEKYIPLEWKNDYKVPVTIDAFLLFENESAIEFANKCIVKKQYEIDRITDVGVTLYKIPDKNVIVCTSSCHNNKVFGQIVEALEPWLKVASEKICVQTLALAHYKTDVAKEVSIIRSLSTDKRKTPMAPRLEIPNIIVGLAAGVINYCNFYKFPATIYICYSETDIFGMDKSIANKIINLLKELKLEILQEFNSRNVDSTTYT